MAHHKILTLRGFYKSGNIITDQLNSSFDEGVPPVLIFPRQKVEENVLIKLANYLRNKFNYGGSYPVLADVGDRSNGFFLPRDSWETECIDAVDSIATLNEHLNNTNLHINHITLKIPSLYPYELARRQWNIHEPDDRLLCPLDINEYLESFNLIRQSLREVVAYAYDFGFTISLENDQPTFFVIRSKQNQIPEDLFEMFNIEQIDPRTGESQFYWQLQSCPSNSNPKFVNLVLSGLESYKTGIMYDPEHWHMTFNYAKNNSIGNRRLTNEERQFIETFGYLVRKGKKILYEETINPAEALSRVKSPVYGLHVVGYPDDNLSFADVVGDKKTVRMAESFPLFFDSENMRKVMEFYADVYGKTLVPVDMSYAINDKDVREQMGREIYDNMRLALAEAVKRQELHYLILEMKSEPGIYSGGRWQQFLRTSKASLEYLLSQG